MNRILLENYLNELLLPHNYDDYCPNGLQIEGKLDISRVLFSVSATRESAEYANKIDADLLVVHHGLFWKFHGPKTITGPFLKRISPLIKKDINLMAYHLPLDGQLQVGNAAAIAQMIGLNNLAPFGNYKGASTGVWGEFPSPMKASELKKILETRLNHAVLYSSPIETSDVLKKVAIITGGANSEWKEAARMGFDAYITGEMSEHDFHESRESGIHMFAAGHHATEKFGIQLLMKNIKIKFPELECLFLDSENPA